MGGNWKWSRTRRGSSEETAKCKQYHHPYWPWWRSPQSRLSAPNQAPIHLPSPTPTRHPHFPVAPVTLSLMGKSAADTSATAGGGSTHLTPADLSSGVLQKAIATIHSSIQGIFFRVLQNGPSASDSPSIEELAAYLVAPTSSFQSLSKGRDWSSPLNEYFISTSHNMYLAGDQLYGSSTSDGYINVLTRGCSCVEIDVWDGDDGVPEVFHGYTLTKEMKFKDVCKTIRKYGFSGLIRVAVLHDPPLRTRADHPSRALAHDTPP